MSEEQNLFESPAAVAPPPPSTEQTQDSEGGSPGNGGVSKSRRRRRKRKNRSSAAQAPNSTAPVQNTGVEGSEAGAIEASSGEPGTPAEPQPREFRRPQQVNQNQNGQSQNGQSQNGQSAHGQGGQTQNGQGQNARRKNKKKFRRAGEGGGQPRPEPGNSIQGSQSGMGARRNRKQQGGSRGPRSFVGPMDHSYREANGNFADSPASTIDMHGSGRRHSNVHRGHHNEDRLPPELMHHHRPIAIPEDAPTHIYFFIEDLFFTAKIQEVAKQQGVKVAFMKPDKDVVAHLAELHDHEHPSLIVFDLNNAAAKPLTLIPKLKNKLKKGTSILGFLSHLQGDLKQKAVEAGCHTVMPRSAFSQNLPNLLRRYGIEDEHEPNFNQ